MVCFLLYKKEEEVRIYIRVAYIYIKKLWMNTQATIKMITAQGVGGGD